MAKKTLVYFYAGVAKINEDWLRAEPLRHWLYSRAANSNIPDTYFTPYFFVLLFNISSYFYFLFYFLFYFILFNCLIYFLLLIYFLIVFIFNLK